MTFHGDFSWIYLIASCLYCPKKGATFKLRFFENMENLETFHKIANLILQKLAEKEKKDFQENILAQMEDIQEKIPGQTYIIGLNLFAALMDKHQSLLEVKIKLEDVQGKFNSLRIDWSCVTARIDGNGAIEVRATCGGITYHYLASQLQNAVTLINYQQCPDPNRNQLSSLLRNRIEEIAQLKAGWDDADAVAFSPELIGSLKEALLKMKKMGIIEPDLFPDPEGSISLQWATEACSFDSDRTFQFTAEKKMNLDEVITHIQTHVPDVIRN